MSNVDSDLIYSLIACKPVHILYRAANGIVSTREVTVNQLDRCKNGEAIARVWDHNRQAPRSFTITSIMDSSIGGFRVGVLR